MRPSTSWFSEASTITRVSRIASRLGSKTASRSATHFGWGVTCTDIGSPPRALELWEKGVLARVSNLAPPCLCTSSCGLITCANGARVAVSVVTAPRPRPVDTIYRPAISSRYIAHAGANMTRHFGWTGFAFGLRPRGVWGGPGGGGPAPPVVRIGGHEVRDPQTPEGQAAPRLRSDERAGRPDARLLFAVAGHGLSDPAMARRRRARRREGRGREEGLRDHRRGAQVSRRAPRPGGRHLRPRARSRGPHARRRDGRREPLARSAREGGVSHRVEGA